jgi:hypothetical protein
MTKQIIISELEKKSIKQMYSLLTEADSSQIQSMAQNLANTFDELTNEFNTIKSQNQNAKTEMGEQDTNTDPCGSIKLLIGLYGGLIARGLKGIATLNLQMAVENDMTKRLEIANQQLEGLKVIANAMKNLTEL